MAQQGNFSMALSSHLQKNSPWIVDSGASDHMTDNSNLFHTFSPCSGNYKVRIADGSTSKVAGIGTITVIKDLILKFVLLVPKLTYNLLSISKLTKDLRGITHFSLTHCDFQDLESGRTIGIRSLRDYIFSRVLVILMNKLFMQTVCPYMSFQTFPIKKMQLCYGIFD